MFLPGIRDVIQAYNESQGSARPTIARIVEGDSVFMAMRVGTPGPLQACFAASLAKQLRQRHPGHLEATWREEGIVEDRGDND